VAPKVSGYLRDVQVSDNQSVKAGQLLATIDDRYIFDMNPVPGIAMVATLWLTLEREPMRLELLRHGDWLGVLTMALGLTALQTVPDEGNKDDWFDRLSSCAFPVVSLRPLARRNFGFGTLSRGAGRRAAPGRTDRLGS
jgi:DHA2 family multidrug resistance protein